MTNANAITRREAIRAGAALVLAGGAAKADSWVGAPCRADAFRSRRVAPAWQEELRQRIEAMGDWWNREDYPGNIWNPFPPPIAYQRAHAIRVDTRIADALWPAVGCVNAA